jgi:hypothetical protein
MVPAGDPEAYRESREHRHRYEPWRDDIEKCSCGALRRPIPKGLPCSPTSSSD